MEAVLMSPGQQGLMQVGKSKENGATVPASTNEGNTDLPVRIITPLGTVLMDLLHSFVSEM
jgi:hypothetical protein